MAQATRARSGPARQRSLVSLAGAVILLLLLNGAIGLYSIRYVSLKNLQALDAIDAESAALDDTLEAQVRFKVQVQEWKNILLRGHVAEDFARYLAAFEDGADTVRARLADLRGQAGAIGLDVAEIDALLAEYEQVMAGYAEALAHHDPADPQAATTTDRRVRGIDRAFAEHLDALAGQARERMAALRTRLAAEAGERAVTIERVSMVGTAVTLGLLVVMLVVTTRRR